MTARAARALQERIEGLAARRPLPGWTLLAVLLLALSAFAYAPLLGGGLIVTGDTSHAYRIYEMHRCLSDGQVPCRWVPDLGNGHGYPLFNYYPPLPYYAGDLLHRLGFSYVRAVDVLFAIGLAGAGLSMFALARRLWGDLGGLVSAVAYVYAPYLALDVYLRGALAELWALAVAPALLWALYELFTTSRARYTPLVALFAALLLLSHNLVAVIMAPAVALWVVVLLALRGREALRPALLGALAAAWGFGLAAFFTLPVLKEGGQVQLDTLSSGIFHYSRHFVSPGDLFLLRTSDYSFLFGGRSGTPVQIGWFHWGLAALALPAVPLLLRSGRRREATVVLLLAASFAVGAFMTTAGSRSVWDTFDSLRFLQFPWRYIGLVSLASAALAGVWLACLRERKPVLQVGVAAGLVALFVISGHAFFHTEYRCDVSDSQVIAGSSTPADPVCAALVAHPEAAAITDYLPKAVAAIPDPPIAPARVVDGSARIVSSDAGSDWLRLRIDVQTAARIEASLFDYPNWRVRVDGQSASHEASSPNGLITFDLPAGTHTVELQLEDTAVRRAGSMLSLVSWGALAVVAGIFMALIQRGSRFRGSRFRPTG